MPEGYSRSFGCAQDDSLFSSRPGRPYVFLASRIVPGDNPPAMRCPRLFLFLLLFLLLPLGSARASEPFFKKGDVIALVGGEDMVVASEYGYLELLLTRALPDYHLRFRNLAWEGDTVFEQRRDLNFPTWEEQLDKIGATVVIAQFGQMESLRVVAAGPDSGRPAHLPRVGPTPHPGLRKPDGPAVVQARAEFLDAYGKLLDRLRAGGQRRVIILQPTGFPLGSPAQEEISKLGMKMGRMGDRNIYMVNSWQPRPQQPPRDRDGVHRSAAGQAALATRVVDHLLTEYISHGRPRTPDGQPIPNTEVRGPKLVTLPEGGGPLAAPAEESLRQLIIAKNRLWFDYWRPQNWAFLAGDRTAQPSSRDHLDPSKRWFPPEREAFLPLLDAKEKEIDALAQQLAAGNAGK